MMVAPALADARGARPETSLMDMAAEAGLI